MLSADYLRSILFYDPETGIFRWIVSKSGIKRIVAGYKHPEGYINITVNGKYYGAHRLAWLYMTGEWPKEQIDHKNRIGTDNRWENLRPATKQQNSMNRRMNNSNRLGIKGVRRVRGSKTFEARICKNGKRFNLGSFKTLIEAKEAYLYAAKELHGEFASEACFVK